MKSAGLAGFGFCECLAAAGWDRFEAEAAHLDCKAALKILAPDIALHKAARARFPAGSKGARQRRQSLRRSRSGGWKAARRTVLRHAVAQGESLDDYLKQVKFPPSRT